MTDRLASVGDGDLPVHRHRGLDPDVGGRRRRRCERRWPCTTTCCASVVEAHGGWVFKHTGRRRVRGLRVGPRRASRPRSRRSGGSTLPVRMGVATGEAQERDGDYFGPALNRAARVMAAGHGGQILVRGVDGRAGQPASTSSTSASTGCGTCRGVERLFQVRADGLASTFPPLRTLDATPGNLPVQLTSFVGRDVEVKELAELVRAHRLVTLTGVGRRRQDPPRRPGRRRAGRRVPRRRLAGRAGPGRRSRRRARRGGDRPRASPARPDRSVTESIAEALSGRRLLLVLDNCEHVLDAAADLVETILTRATTVQVLATSREGLRVAASSCGRSRPSTLGPGPTSPAVELFVERARAVQPRLRARRARRGRGRDRDLPAPRRHRPGHRAGRGPHGVDERPGGARPPRRPVPPARRARGGARAPPDAAPRGVVVLRPARRRRADAAGPLLGVRRRLRRRRRRPRLRRRRRRRATRCSTCSTRWCASRSSPPSRSAGHDPVRPARDDPPVRARSSSTGSGITDEVRRPPRRVLRRRGRRRTGTGGTARAARSRSTGWTRVRRPAGRLPLGRRPRRARQRRRRSPPTPRMLALVLQRFEPVGWAEEILAGGHGGRPPASSPALYTPPASARSPGAPEAGRRLRRSGGSVSRPIPATTPSRTAGAGWEAIGHMLRRSARPVARDLRRVGRPDRASRT